MAQSLSSDFKIYNAEFNGGFNETLQQFSMAFGAASRGTMVVVPERLRGHYDKESMFDVISTLVQRRDTTSTSTASDTALTQDEFIGVKINRKVGPVAISLDALKKIGQGEDAQRESSFIIGQQAAKAITLDYLNSLLRALQGSIQNQSSLLYDYSGTGTIISEALVDGLAKFGDAAESQLLCWVMHSKVYYNLVKDQVTDAVYRADGVSIMEGTPATFGRPVIVTDSAALVETDGVSTGVNKYSTLCLRAGAGRVVESEPATMVTDLVTGYENMFYRVQGEHAFNLQLAGFKWDTSNGGENPTDANIALGSNWDMAVTSYKLLPGICIDSQ